MHRAPLHGLAMWDITGGEPEEACLDEDTKALQT